ncbi:hypothetical protein [Nonomuraea sp. NPDC050786]|uniref:phage tail tube protein n=1 Tax=Nonomuraea sp. NPDC050786 TaxID=3154840 RepID=UPI003404EB1B
MPAPEMTPAVRFFPTGTTRYLWVPTIAAGTKIPTRTEIDAGTDLSTDLAEVSGFTVSSDLIDTPDINKRFTKRIAGRITAEDSSLTFYADRTGDDVRALLPMDEEGFIVRLPGGDVAASMGSTFPVTVSSISEEAGTDDEAGRLVVEFAITDEPAVNWAVPAHAGP